MQYADKQTPVSKQRFGKQVSVATDTNATTEERCFLWGPCRHAISRTVWSNELVIGLELSAVQLSEVAGWWVSSVNRAVQLKVSLWREDYEVGVKWPPAWDPVISDDSWQEFCTGLEHGSIGIAIVNIRYQTTTSEDCNRLRRHSV
jgi:hypothetical protein